MRRHLFVSLILAILYSQKVPLQWALTVAWIDPAETRQTVAECLLLPSLPMNLYLSFFCIFTQEVCPFSWAQWDGGGGIYHPLEALTFGFSLVRLSLLKEDGEKTGAQEYLPFSYSFEDYLENLSCKKSYWYCLLFIVLHSSKKCIF